MAIEQAWAHFWEVTDHLPTVAEAERRNAASSVAVEPTLAQVLNQAKSLADNGLVVYGRSIFHPYWDQSVDGHSTAMMEDCTDTSQSGSMVAATGERRTVGVPDNNTRATFVKAPMGFGESKRYSSSWTSRAEEAAGGAGPIVVISARVILSLISVRWCPLTGSEPLCRHKLLLASIGRGGLVHGRRHDLGAPVQAGRPSCTTFWCGVSAAVETNQVTAGTNQL